MIALDTNILVRFIVQDDPIQCRQTDELMATLSPSEPGWISFAVVMELVWVLTKIYRLGQPAIVPILTGLLDRDEFDIQHRATLQKALDLYRTQNADFDDCLIAESARAAGCAKTLTFDKKAAGRVGVELIE
ncbi:MAG: PIN domain-containing protein [Terracidiphilus sp.]